MKTYSIIPDETGVFYIKAIHPNGLEVFLPQDQNNRDYAEYLRYTAWVEAGNSPEDFWIAEGNTPEVIND